MLDADTHCIKVDYTAHDSAYRRNKEQGLPGWNCAEEISEHIAQLTGIFACPVIPETGRILDIGCGAGNISFWLESRGYQVTGIDVSAVAIDWAKEQAQSAGSRADFMVFNAAQDEFHSDALFDIVLDNHCLHCIIGDDRKTYLQNIIGNLMQDGIYIVNTMCDNVNDTETLKYFDADSRYYFRNGKAIRYIGKHQDIICEIETAGFEILYMNIATDDIQDSMSVIARKK